jgi:hypothetical protein
VKKMWKGNDGVGVTNGMAQRIGQLCTSKLNILHPTSKRTAALPIGRRHIPLQRLVGHEIFINSFLSMQ